MDVSLGFFFFLVFLAMELKTSNLSFIISLSNFQTNNNGSMKNDIEKNK